MKTTLAIAFCGMIIFAVVLIFLNYKFKENKVLRVITVVGLILLGVVVLIAVGLGLWSFFTIMEGHLPIFSPQNWAPY